MPTAIEQHVDWIADCVGHMRAKGLSTIEPIPEAQEKWVAHTAEVAEGTLYPKANSWYFGSNIPGKPRAFGVYLGGFGNYRQQCSAIAAKGYEGFRFENTGA
jgi:cyclohexanone monooxygenase